MKHSQEFIRAFLWAIILSCILAACSSPTAASEPQAWIDFPRDGSSIPLGATVTLVSHAYTPTGVSDVLLLVDGTAYRRDPPSSPGDTLVEVRQEWIAAESGLHTLEIRTYDTTGELSASDAITLRVIGEESELPIEVPPPTEVPPVTELPPPTEVTPPTDTPTPTVTPAPLPEVNFWVDDDSIEAGECTTLHWEVSWATTATINGTEVAGTGTWSVCPEDTTTYTLHAEGPGGNTDESIIINVSEPPDANPPPVPTPFVPANGLALSCRSKQNLIWLPVEDRSGVVYFVKLERQVTATSWDPVRSWGPVSDKQVEADVQCGVSYRWAVRAQDGAGNTNVWSAWYTFGINLP